MKNKYIFRSLFIIMVLLCMQSVCFAANYYETKNGFKIYPVEKIDWYEDASKASFLYKNGTVFEVMDYKTGYTFKIKRRWGDCHTDFEPLTAADTATICKIYGVSNANQLNTQNKYQRRGLLLTYNERTIACSMYAQPHDETHQTIKTNNFNGVGCLHFTNSKGHNSQAVDADHQAAINAAYEYAKKLAGSLDGDVIDVGSVTALINPSTISVGETAIISTTIYPSNATNKSLKYSSSNVKIAKVDSTGKVTGVASGTAKITVTSVANSKATQTLNIIVNKAPSVSLSASDKLYVGKTTQLNAYISSAKVDNTTLTWSSSNTKVAKVDSNGVVTGVSNGTVTITAKSKSNSNTKGTLLVTVLKNSGSQTPSNIPTADEMKQMDVLGTVTATTKVNLRKGPGTSYARLGSMIRNQTLQYVTSYNNSGTIWYGVKINANSYGWVMGKYVTSKKLPTTPQVDPEEPEDPVVDPEEPVNPVDDTPTYLGKIKVTSSTLNVRKNAGTSYARIGVLKKNDTFKYMAIKKVGSETWYNIELSNGTKGWVMGKYVKVYNS